MREESPLLNALKNADLSAVNELIEQGEKFPAELNFFDLRSIYGTIFRKQAFGLLEIMESHDLYEKDVYEYSNFSDTLFDRLFRELPVNDESLDFLKQFMASFQNINDEVNGHTLLSYAISLSTNPEIVKTLIESGCRADYVNQYNQTLLFTTLKAYINEEEYTAKYLQYLIDNGADINLQDVERRTALMMAVDKNLFDSVKLLLDNGADCLLTDKNGEDVFSHAVTCQFSIELYNLLKEYGSPDFDRLNGDNESLLYRFLRMMNGRPSEREMQLFEQLLVDGASLYTVCLYYNQTTLPIDLVLKKPAEVLKMAIEKSNVDINNPDNQGNTLLHKVCAVDVNFDREAAKEIYRKVKLLLAEGADPSLTNDKDETALMLASSNNLKAKTVELLLTHKA